MRYRYFVDFRHGISVFANFSYGIAVLGTPQCSPPNSPLQFVPPVLNMIFQNTLESWTIFIYQFFAIL